MKTNEIDLNKDNFTKLNKNDYIIIELGIIDKDDYILFKEVDEEQETGNYRMTQVNEVVQDDGLKDGYALLRLKMF